MRRIIGFRFSLYKKVKEKGENNRLAVMTEVIKNNNTIVF